MSELELLEKERPAAPPIVADEDAPREDEDADRDIRCRACDFAVTRPKWRIAQNGRHIHVFTNPHGYVFQIGTFSEAPGAAATGIASDEWAWFEGTVWRIAACRACLTHLGWSFARGEEQFWGLITAKLVD